MISAYAIRRFTAEMVIKRLQTDSSTMLLVGVERFNIDHCIKLAEMLSMVKPQCIITQLNPDNPFFIHNEKGFIPAWTDFVTGKGGKFLINPRPNHLQDALLNKESITQFLMGTLLNSKGFTHTSSNLAYTTHDSFYAAVKDSTLQADCFVTSLLYHANNTEIVSCSLIADLPELIYRDMVVRKSDLEDMQEYFNQYLAELEEPNVSFDPRTLNSRLMLEPKGLYIAELLKQISFTYNLIFAVVDSNVIYSIEDAWKAVKKDPINLKEFMKIPPGDETCSVVEYTEKHCILDMIFGPFLQNFFLKHGVFPYTATGMIGVKDGFYSLVKDAWKHYYAMHAKTLTDHINLLVSASHSKGEKEKTTKKTNKAGRKIKSKEKKVVKNVIEEEESD